MNRRKVPDPKTRVSTIRWTVQQYDTVSETADQAGMSVGTFLRTIALGSPGPRAVRKAPVEKRELARILGAVGKVGGNVNQLAHAWNASGAMPGFPELLAIRQDIAAIRAALMTALGKGP